MQRCFSVAGIVLATSLAVLLPTAPASAVTAKQKMVTCEFGADHPGGGAPKLVGAKRKHFLDRCMLNKNDPRGPAVGTPGATGMAGGAPAPK